MILVLLVILLFTLPQQSNFQEKFVRWEKMAAPEFVSPQIPSGKSIDDFWVFDARGILFHKIHNKWLRFPLGTKSVLKDYKIWKTGEGRFLLTGITDNWNSHLFIFNKNSWREENYIIKNPISHFLKDGNKIYVTGDWAEIDVYENGTWKKINAPFHNHINVIKKYKSNIFFAVRNEGIWGFDGNKFEKFKLEGDEKTDYSQFSINELNQLSVGNTRGEYFQFVNGKFVKIPKHRSNKLSVYKYDFAHYALNLPDYFPGTEVLIPNNYFPFTYKILEDSIIILSSHNRDIYYSKFINNNYFENLAVEYRVEGHSNENTLGAAFCNLNGADELPGLFEFNNYSIDYSQFYINRNSKPFLSYDPFFEVKDNLSYILFALGDFNHDGAADIVLNHYSYDNNKLVYFINRNSQLLLFDSLFLPKTFSAKPLRALHFDNFYSGENPVLSISAYYGNGVDKGGELLIHNTGLYNVPVLDTNYFRQTRGWAVHSICADFNNDGLNDWLIVNQWQQLKLLIQSNKEEGKFHTVLLPNDKSEAPYGAMAFDYDNDGDLDIAVSSDLHFVEILRNDLNLNGNFTGVTARLELQEYYNKSSHLDTKKILAPGDFNNDGYLDFAGTLYKAGENENFLFINEAGKGFAEKGSDFGITQIPLNGVITGDFDNDGDIDIYGYRNGLNILWVNNLNNSRYLNVFPKGVKSNMNGLQAKVWVYKTNTDSLLGFRQIGSEDFTANQFNQKFAHFGLPEDSLVDVVVKFSSGETTKLQGVRVGQSIAVSELSGLAAWVYIFPRMIIRFVVRTENQIYILIVLLGLVILFLETKIGMSKFNWSVVTALIFILFNLSIFWVLIFLTRDSELLFQKFILPVFILIVVSGLPLLFNYSIRKYSESSKNKNEMEEKLLRDILLFTHGEWALRNISGLKLLLENVPASSQDFPGYLELIRKREKTFMDMTLPLITSIAEICETFEIERGLIQSIKTEIKRVKKNHRSPENIDEQKERINLLSESFALLLTAIGELRNNVLKIFSCNPEDVIREITAEYSGDFNQRNIDFKKYKNYAGIKFSLIKNYELANVLDNCIKNSIAALANTRNPFLQVTVISKPPKILIELSDNGFGIEKENWEIIFEGGYSKSGSTGIGLFTSKKIIEKYNGRFFVKESEPGKKTTFTIELNEGVLT